MALFGLLPDGPQAQAKLAAEKAKEAAAAAQKNAQGMVESTTGVGAITGALKGMPPPPKKQ